MGHRFRTTKGLIWYHLADSSWVAVIPTRNITEKCLLIKDDDVGLIKKFSGPEGIQEESLSPVELEQVRRWSAPEFGIVEKIEEKNTPDPYANLAYSVFKEYQSARDLEAEHDLTEYHKNEIKDSFRQFEEVEMTVSHIYRDPHPALGNRSYGARFSRVLLDEGALEGKSDVLEVGCGTGIFGREFLKEIRSAMHDEIYQGMNYIFFDISPVLSATQEEINKEHGNIVSFKSGDVSTYSFGEERYNVIIANEMIADLPVVKMKGKEIPDKETEDKAGFLVRQLGLDLSDAPPEFLLNTGALQFIIKISEALKKGGRAYIVEYGDPSGYPVGYNITNHKEHSIHFGHMLTVARQLGLDGSLETLPDFLGFDRSMEVLDDQSHHALFGHLLPFLGIKTESSVVYTRSMLTTALPQIIDRINNLNFVPLDSMDGIVYPKKFYVLKMKKEG